MLVAGREDWVLVSLSHVFPQVLLRAARELCDLGCCG